LGVPSIIGLNQASRLGFAAGTNLDLVVVGEMTLAGNVREQVGYIAEVWLFGAYVAVQRDAAVGCHCGTMVVVRSVSEISNGESAVPAVQLVKQRTT